jgi:hypothetical protein
MSLQGRRVSAWRSARSIAAVFVVATALTAQALSSEPMIDFTVSPADTLIDLSNNVLVSPHAWREVAKLNKLSNPNFILPGQVLRIPIRLLRGGAVNARLVSIVGDVRRGDSPAVEGDPVSEGQSVQTGPGGSAVIALADGSRMRLPPSSLAELAASRSYGQRPSPVPVDPAAEISSGWFAGTLRVLRGSVEVFATKVLRAKPLEVVTPTAVVGVRGTKYRVGVNEDAANRTHSEVLEGSVHLDALSGSASVELQAGYGGALGADSKLPAVAPLLAAPDLSSMPTRFERPIVRIELPGEPSPLRVQVASDAAFEKMTVDQRVPNGGEIRIAGLADAQWFLRARRIDTQGIEGFDSTRSFVLKATPQPPAYRTPRAGAKQTVGDVAFAWASNVDSPRARLQVAEDSAFTRIAIDRDNIESAEVNAQLTTAGSYYWRLASIRPDGDHGPFGDAQSFELRPTPEPPKSTQAADGKSLVFNWSGRAEDRQQVQLARDPQFTQITAQDELSATEWTLPMPASGGRYYFRYRSIEPDGFVGPYSETLMVDVPRDWSILLLLLPPALMLVF